MYSICYVGPSANGESGPEFVNVVTQKHPFAWLDATRRANPQANIQLVGWKELIEEDKKLAPPNTCHA